MKGESNVIKRRNGLSGNQHFLFDAKITGAKIPFELIIDLPKPQYARIIVQRDKLGRIAHSRPSL